MTPSFPIPERAMREIDAGRSVSEDDARTISEERARGIARSCPVEQAAAARDEGMTRVEVAADPDWKVQALAAIYRVAQSRPDFISDDVWTLSGLDEPKEARALGPLFREAARRGWIVKTDRTRPSVRSNLSGKPVWKSLLFGGGTG